MDILFEAADSGDVLAHPRISTADSVQARAELRLVMWLEMYRLYTNLVFPFINLPEPFGFWLWHHNDIALGRRYC